MFSRPILIGLLCCLILSGPVRAQVSPSPISSIAEAVKSFDPVEATQAWLATVPADKRAKSDAYFEGGYWLILWNFIVGAAISIFLLSSRISARLRDFAERTTRFKALQVALYAIPYFLLVALLSFPLMVYEQFYREHKYEMATQSFGPW